jgi:hypothetical protein
VYYAQLTARIGWPTARVAAARKLVRILYQMLRTNTPWCPVPTASQTERDELREIAVALTTETSSD